MSRPRVLHLIKSLPFGGIETWLVHLLRHQERFGVQHEILLMKEEPAAYENEVRAMGIPIHKLPMMGGWLTWLRDLERFLKRDGAFAAFHCHLAVIAAGPVMVAAKRSQVPVRIVHMHEARSQGVDYRGVVRRMLEKASVGLIKSFSTRRIGISEASIQEIAGSNWRRDPAASVLLYGFDYKANDGAPDRAERLRANLGISQDAPIIGHVGRFAPVKNHEFALRTFAAFRRIRPDSHLVMVGTGPRTRAMRDLARELGIEEASHFAGTTEDVPAYMALFDAFLFPSFSEGLGIVVLEAQAAGTPTLMTDSLPHEVIVVPEIVERLPLSHGVDRWAVKLDELIRHSKPNRLTCRRRVEESQFGMLRCVDELNQIYLAELAHAK